VTSTVTWPFDSPYPISYWCSIVTKPLSPALLEILGPKYNWVTTLTFLGHVTSSVTWPFDSPYPISCWCSIVTKPLSLTAFEMILGSKVPDLCKSSLRMRDITWPVPPMLNLGTYLNFSPHIAYSLWHFYWAPMKNKMCLLVRPPMLNMKSSENFVQKFANFGLLGGLVVRGFKNYWLLVQKAHLCVNTRRLSHFAWRSVWGSDHQGRAGKKSESHRDSQRKDMSPLTQGLNYRSACDYYYTQNSVWHLYDNSAESAKCATFDVI